MWNLVAILEREMVRYLGGLPVRITAIILTALPKDEFE